MLEMGRPLKKGEVILSGALGPMVPIQKGDFITTKIADFEEVCFRVV
jgi:2-keto-4-pentenoate hydratase